MKYVPNLLPEENKVLKNYFKGSPYSSKPKNKWLVLLQWIVGVYFILFGLTSFPHFILFLLYTLIGFILIPKGKKLIEEKLKFSFTRKLRLYSTSSLFLISIPLFIHFEKVDNEFAAKREAEKQKIELQKQIEKEIFEKKEQLRIDSLNFFFSSADSLINKGKFSEASHSLLAVTNFLSTKADKNSLNSHKAKLYKQKTQSLMKSRQYKDALISIDSLSIFQTLDNETIINKAVIFSKTGKKQEAVTTLKPLLNSGNSEAIALHEKINPIRRRVAYYVTRCCDGSTSSAKGRGACSHHGGVCNWNEPVYQEYRKYE